MSAFERIQPSHWNRLALKRVLHACSGKRVLIVGDVGVDRYTMGSVERISPEAPVPIVLVEREELKLGLAANVADNVMALGGAANLVGVVGADHAAGDFRKLLKRAGIPDSHLVTDRSRRTVLKERVVSERQQLLRIDYETPHGLADAVARKVVARVKALIARVDAVVIQDYAKGLLNDFVAREILAAAKRAGKVIAIDPNRKTAASVYRCSGQALFKPNLKEAELLAGIPIHDEDSLRRAGFKILKLTGAKDVVITRGKEGMAIFSRGSSRVRLIPTHSREVYDVSGAGDTVVAVLALALAAGSAIEEACILANLAAGVEVGKRGTATVTPDEILVAMEFFGAGI